ncbi:MAG: sugar ABC transporter permease [Hyphomicrobiales bacterium]
MKRIHQNKAWLLVLPAAVILCVGGIAPVMTAINYSVQDSFSGNQYFWAGSTWYEQILQSAEFWKTLARTGAFTAITLCLQFIIGIAVARKLYHAQIRPEIFIPLFSLPLLTPWIVVGFLWRRMMDADVGLLGSVLSALSLPPNLNDVGWAWLIIVALDVWHWTGIIVILCYAGYLAIPKPFFQAAKIDGASPWKTFRYVELPKLCRVLIVACLIRMADSLMIYTEPFMITRGGPHVATTFLSQDIIQTATLEFNLGEAGAISAVYLLLVVPLAWMLFRSVEKPQ